MVSRYQGLPPNCRENPEVYRICGPWVCVTRNETCPCPVDEFLCTSKECISQRRLCDGISDCQSGEDEDLCSADGTPTGSSMTVSGVPLSVFIGAIVSCVIIILSLSVCLFYVAKRYIRQKSQHSNLSSKEALQSDCGYDVITAKNKESNMEMRSCPKSHLVGLSKYNLGYELVSQDTLCNFGEELLCTSTPRQGVRGVAQITSSDTCRSLFVNGQNNNDCKRLSEYDQSDNRGTKHEREPLTGSDVILHYKRISAIQGNGFQCGNEPHAIGDGTGGLNMSLFESIT